MTSLIGHIRTWIWLGRKRRPAARAPLPPISIIKPVRGVDQEAEENFLSFIHADYPAPFEVIFAVENRDDPVVPLIERLVAGSKRSRLVFSRRQDQRELGKTINLMEGIKESAYEFLVFSDSDVRNTPGLLEELASALCRPGTGLVYACPVYKGANNWVSGLMALAVNETVVRLSLAPRFTVLGNTMATRKEILRQIGGMARLRHRIGVDAALGRAVHGKGYRIELIRQPATIIDRAGSFSSWWQQIHRWFLTIRCYLGAAYFAVLFYSFPVLWASLYLALSLFQGKALQGLAVLSAILAARFASAAAVNLFFAKEPAVWRYLWLLPVLEFLTFLLWVESFFNPYVVWRGRKYRVVSDATVRPAG